MSSSVIFSLLVRRLYLLSVRITMAPFFTVTHWLKGPSQMEEHCLPHQTACEACPPCCLDLAALICQMDHGNSLLALRPPISPLFVLGIITPFSCPLQVIADSERPRHLLPVLRSPPLSWTGTGGRRKDDFLKPLLSSRILLLNIF
jgi:hypothetical protein